MATKTDPVAQKMSEASLDREQQVTPHQGDKYRCDECGMAIEVTRGCGCDEAHAEFSCCHQPMSKA